MAKVNFDDVWKEASSSDFVNIEPESEYDMNAVRRHADMIRQGFEILNGPTPLTPEQRNDLLIKLRRLQRILVKESVSANRLDPRVPVYRRN